MSDAGTTEPRAGMFRSRLGRGAPWSAVRISHESDGWTVRVNEVVQPGSGAADWIDVPFLLMRWGYLHEIDAREYAALLAAHAAAPEGHPLATPGAAVNLRAAPSLYRRPP